MKRLIFGMIAFTIVVFGAPQAFADSFCDTSYVEIEPGFGFQYKVITPTDYTITGGEFLSICVEPDYLWYTIYLDVKEPGSLTVTIPKDVVDLKQFNYESCYPDDLDTADTPDAELYDHGIATVKQISETKDSRTLKFSWSEPISKIDYFGGYTVIDEKFITMLDDKYVIMLDDDGYIPILDGGYITLPNHCIDLVESGQLSADIQKHNSKPPQINPQIYENYTPFSYCEKEIELNYNITRGTVDKICKDSGQNSVIFFINDVSLPSKLTTNISYDYYPPSVSKFEAIIVSNNFEIPHLVTIDDKENVQTFQIELLPNTKLVEIVYPFLPGRGSDLIDDDNLRTTSTLKIKNATWHDYYDDCITEIILNYTLNHGKVVGICEPTDQIIILMTSDIVSNSVLTIDIPYTTLPLMTKDNQNDFLLLLDGLHNNNLLNLTHQYPKYQTFEIDLIPDVIGIELIYDYDRFLTGDNSNEIDDEYNLTIPLLEIENPNNKFEKSSCKSDFVSVMKHDYSKSACVTPTTAEKLIKRGWAI